MDCAEIGTVKSVVKDTARVAISRTHECGGCKACIFAGKGDIVILARNNVGACAGDRVRVDAKKSGKQSLLAVAIGLGIPLLFMIFSIVICRVTGLEDWINLVVSLGALVVGFCVTIAVDRLLRRSKLAAEITEILSESDEPAQLAEETKENEGISKDNVGTAADAARPNE